jgi:hypothetical protein
MDTILDKSKCREGYGVRKKNVAILALVVFVTLTGLSVTYVALQPEKCAGVPLDKELVERERQECELLIENTKDGVVYKNEGPKCREKGWDYNTCYIVMRFGI